MKKYLFLLIAFLSLSISLNAQTCATSINQWQTLGNPNVPRFMGFNFVIGNKAYVGGGSYVASPNGVSGGYLDIYNVYDANLNTWSPNFLSPLSYDGVGFSIGGKGYLLCGKTTGPTAIQYSGKFYEFDPNTGIWTDRSSALTGKDQLLYASNMVAMSINGKAYIGGGSYGTTATSTGTASAMAKWYEFDPSSNSFTEFSPGTPGTNAPLSGDAYSPSSFVIGDSGYVFSYTKLWRFKPASKTFDLLEPATTYPYPEVARTSTIAFAIGNKGYVGFGDYGTGSSSGLYEFSTANDKWNTTNLNASTIVSARFGATAFSIADKGYLFGGVTGLPATLDRNFYYFTGSVQPVLKTVTTAPTTNNHNLCPGSSFPVYYLKNCGSASSSTLTVQLSDANGAFSKGSTSIGTTTITRTNTDGSITCTIPSTITSGTKYRVRVVALADANIGLDNGTNITIAAALVGGTISHPYSVPFPREKVPDSIKNTLAPIAPSYLWQRSTDTTNVANWQTISGATAVIYTLPTSDVNDVYFRRGANLACLTTVYSNVLKLRVYSASNSRLNGAISGKVTSQNGVGVFGITITAQKNTALLGSPVTKMYTATTDQSGSYTIPNIFYGDLNAGDSPFVVFTITPSLNGHTFSPTTTTATLSQQIPSEGSNDFVDLSTYSITGKVTQFCSTCDVNFQNDSLNDVQIGIAKNGVSFPSSTTGSNGYGRFGLTVTDPGLYRLTPSKKNHLFSPFQKDTTVVASNIDRVIFADTTQYTISGVFKAGANQSIGTVQLIFSDTVLGRASRFKRTVTTAADGSYSVKLPARKYKVLVNSFSPSTSGEDIAVNDLLTWFNTTLKDSNYIDIDTSNKTFDLIYHRAPVLVIENLPDTCNQGYVAFKQYEARNFAFKVYEGNPDYECLLSYDTVSKIKLTTNVHKEDVNEILEYKPTNGVAAVSLKGGSPNIVADYNKFFSATFKDKYNRQSAILTRNVKVLGTKADPATFTTVSPEVPILILHAPPGDQSSSTWEQTQTIETAMRFSAVTDRTLGGFVDVTLGTSFSAGIGMSIETSIWANINASFSNTQRVINNSEAIISTSTTVGYATSANGGDVFVGGALNLTYAVANELKYSSACILALKSSLAIAPKGFATTYTYSEIFITETLIPSLRFIANLSPDSSVKYLNQIKVWEQVIANNNANKERAEFVRNRSFDGSAGAITESTTSSASQSNSLEFEVEVNTDIAISLGFEIGGSGLNGGANIGLKMTTGSGSTTTNNSSTTMGYTLDDDDVGDYFSVDIKKDPVYSTPVFVLVAGTASCPAEPIAQSRDNVQLSIPTPEIRNIPANEEVLFQLRLQNTSESRETRTYLLTFNQASNPNGALVTIGGSPVTSNISYTIPYLGSQTVTVSVRKSAASNIYSYEGLEFTLSDACEGGVEKSNTISAHFISPCSNLILNAPVNNWIVKSSDNNVLPVEYTGYNLSNLQSVALEYARAGRGDWVTDTIVYQNFISNPTNSVLYWNIADIADGEYDIRMKLNCLSGSGYTQRLTGIIDRTAPRLFGLPKPTDRNYVTGDEISMSFIENLQTNNLNNNKVTMTRMLDGTDIPVEVSGYQNKVMILPMINLNSFASGESIRIIAKQIADIYGNESLVSDTFSFNVGASVASNSNRRVTLSNVVATKRAIFENSGDSLQIKFSLPTASAYNTVVNYLVSGSAQFESDYANSFSGGQNLTTGFNGTQGTINIPANATSAILRIKPMADDDIEANETVMIRLLSGGDYKLGADSFIVITDTIRNDDLAQPEISMGDVPRTYPTGYCATVTDNNLAKPYIWNVPTTLPEGYCTTIMDDGLLRPYVWNVPIALPTGYCAIQMDYSLAKTISTTSTVIPTTLPTGYCYAEAQQMSDEQIFSVSFGSMNNVQSDDCTTSYTDYSATISAPTVLLGDVIPFSVNTDECDAAPYYPTGLSIYLDYNRDGDFDDAGEQAYTTTETMMSPNIRSGNIQIPTTATRGLTKMRVVISEGNPSPASCGNMGYGEVEDYSVMIDSDVTPAPSIFEDEQIFAVSFGTMNNTQTENCDSNYTDYTSIITAPIVSIGETVPFSVLTNECNAAPYFASGISVYIDYNRDGDFDDANEQAYTTSITTMSPNTRSGNIVIPVDAAEGLTKMRIIVAEGVTSPGSCMNIGYGEVEDYSIMIHGIPTPQSINDDEQIFAVSFGTMNNVQSETCSTNYTDYTTSVTAPIVTTGTLVPFSVFTDECDAAPYYASGMSIFIDYNRDGDFDDADEKAYTTNGTTVSPSTRTGNIYIPSDASLGLTKMRIVLQDGDVSPASCITLGYGEVEDYAIMIHGVPPEMTVLDDEQIKAVSFGTINNVQNDDCSANYTDYASSILPSKVTIGETVPFSVLTDECDNAPYYGSGMSIFIDYNRDGDFDDVGEKAYTTNDTTMSPNTRSGNIVIPTNASIGLTKMRVVVAEGIASPGSCVTMGYGEVEDYGVIINNVVIKTICQGGTGVLAANDNIDGYPVYSYVWKKGNDIIGTSRVISINSPGTYTLKVYTANGFSGVSMPYVVTATAPPTSDDYNEICPSQLPFNWNGTNYTSTGNYNKTISNANSCDSIVTLHLTVKPNSYAVETINAVDSFEWHGNLYYASTNTPTWTGTNSLGCDSVVTLHLNITYTCVPTNTLLTITSCGSYTWNGIRFYNSILLEWTGINSKGCDSIVTLDLTIKNTTESTTNVSVCASQLPYVWNNITCSSAGIFTKRLTNAVGCDSTAKLFLSVKQLTSSTINISVCNIDMPYIWNGVTYTTGGTYIQNFTNAEGCDSISSLVLTVKPVSNSNTNLAICSNQTPFTWNGLTLTSPGSYSVSFNNVYGCDSLAILNLTVKQVSYVTETIAATGTSYNWHGTTYTTSNYSATWIGINAAGCDSVVTLNLTLTNDCVPTESTLNVTACNIYYFHGIRLTSSTSLEWVGVNAGGCDSVEILNLTITNVSPSASPATITQTLVSNVCGARVYRYTSAAVTNAVGYNWTLPISVGGVSGVFVDSGDATNSRIILVRYASTSAAFTTDSIKVRAYSPCGTTGNRSAKLLNTLFAAPVAPASITIAPIVTNICGLKKYRFIAPALPVATTTNVAATGYIWAFRGVLGASIDSGNVNSKVITVTFSSNAAAATGDSIKLAYSSLCGNSLYKASKLTNTLLAAPLAPATVTVTPFVTNICGARKYRYTAAGLVASTTTATAASGWLWSLPAEGIVGSTGVLDSGTINSQTIVLVYSSNAAAIAGDSIRVRYTSGCGFGATKATKLTNTLLGAPLAPATITIATVSDICGARVYRYTAQALPIATTTAGAANGYLWHMPKGTLGLTGVLDSGSLTSKVIKIRYSSNAAALTGDSIKVAYTSVCGNSLAKAQKLSNLAPTLLAAPATLTGTTSICSVVGSSTSNRYIASAVTGALSYVWTLPAGAVLDSGSNGLRIKVRFLTAGANDSIFVQAIGTNGCAGTKKVLKLITTGCVTQLISRTNVPSTTKTSIDPMKVNIYPNPTTNAFQMFVKTPSISKITMRVLDVQGRLIKTNSFNSDETIAFGNDLKSGVYMVEVREGNEVKTVRVVKY